MARLRGRLEHKDEEPTAPVHRGEPPVCGSGDVPTRRPAPGRARPPGCGSAHRSLRRIELTCFSTVLTEIVSAAAISRSVDPRSRWTSTSRSRSVKANASRAVQVRVEALDRETGHDDLPSGGSDHRVDQRPPGRLLADVAAGAGAERARHQLVARERRKRDDARLGILRRIRVIASMPSPSFIWRSISARRGGGAPVGERLGARRRFADDVEPGSAPPTRGRMPARVTA